MEKEEEMFFWRNHWDPVTAILWPDAPTLEVPAWSFQAPTDPEVDEAGSQVSPSLCCPHQWLPFFVFQHSQIIVKENLAGNFAVSSLKLGYTTVAWASKEAVTSFETCLPGEPKT